MIPLELQSPSPVGACSIGFILSLILIIFLLREGSKLKKATKNKTPFRASIIMSVTLLIIGIYLSINHWLIINTYWYYYDYDLRLIIQTSVFLLLIFFGLIFSILIIHKIKDNKKQIFYSSILAGLLLIFALLTPFITDFIEVKHRDKEYIYQLTIETTSNNSFTLYCPTIYKDNPMNVFFSDNEINGNAIIENIETEYGTAMKIYGKGNITIDFYLKGYAEFKWDYELYNRNKSAPRDQRFEYLIYYNSLNNQSASIELYWGDMGLGRETEIRLKGELIENGWQIISGTKEVLCIA